MSSKPQTMGELVKDLAASGAGALEELREFRDGIRMVARNFGDLFLASRRAALEVTELASTIPEAVPIQGRVALLNMVAEKLNAAFDECEREMQSWKIPDAADGSAPLTN